MKSEILDNVTFNSINVGAIGMTFINLEQTLTLLVLVTALIYNIKKITKGNE